MAKPGTRQPAPPTETAKARTIMEHARTSYDTFLQIFDILRTDRRATGGMTTDQEQDLLRAMLVFAAAGLDSALKQLIRDALRTLAAKDANVQCELEVFVQRQLRGTGEAVDVGSGTKFLARILVAREPQRRLVEDYIHELTGTSLQSPDQLFKTVKALGLEANAVAFDDRRLRGIFDVRNKIIHELDINFHAPRRKRNTRSRDAMLGDAQELVRIGDKIVELVEQKVRAE